MEISEHFTELSIRMTKVLDDIGAGKDTVIERRRTYLWRECMMELVAKYGGYDIECFHFGSQSEGTTIPGLKADIDFLASPSDTNIMRVWGDWEAGMKNLLMLHDDTTPPQQYLLQVIRRDTPEPETSLRDLLFVRKDSGQILFSAEIFKEDYVCHVAYQGGGEVIRNGPSVSEMPNWDMVRAFHVCKPLPEIHQWIDRCRGRHWPPVQLLEAARVAPCFLVPVGHHDSDYKREEWRLSPNLIERMLMFSFNMTQIKCYIILKLIKKSLFYKIVGDCITSFHSKTIMFYTIERTHPSLWFEHNLMFLVSLCLKVLRKFLHFERLPHYIIHGVNLFDGKISKVQRRRLLVYIDSMFRSNLQEVVNIDIDRIGCRLRGCSILRVVKAGEKRRVCVHDYIDLPLKFGCMNFDFSISGSSLTFDYRIYSSNTNVQQSIQYLFFTYCSKNVRLNPVTIVLIKHMYAVQNSLQLSNCLRLQNDIDSEIIRRFKYTLYDVASSRLKLASILYCSGHIHAAVRVLEDVERRFHNNDKYLCGCGRYEIDSDLNAFNNMQSGNSEDDIGERHFAYCVKFSRQESYCTPAILLFGMNRNVTEQEVAQRHWIDSAEVDARYFLYYLQYLTYGSLGERNKQLHYLSVLASYIRNKHITVYHHESLILLGHCYEMEGDYSRALDLYESSLRCSCQGNHAANWHIRRVLRLING